MSCSLLTVLVVLVAESPKLDVLLQVQLESVEYRGEFNSFNLLILLLCSLLQGWPV